MSPKHHDVNVSTANPKAKEHKHQSNNTVQETQEHSLVDDKTIICLICRRDRIVYLCV
jgi:N-acetylmuramoyl-L-alanine amidase CwlA